MIFSLNVHVFAGVDIDSACNEAMRLADTLQIVVTFDFNGVECMARPGDSARDLAVVWDRELRSKHAIKIACASRAAEREAP